MAELQDDSTKQQPTPESALDNAERLLESVKETLQKMDDMESKWKDIQRQFGEKLALTLQATFGVSLPSTLTEEEKLAVLGGKPTLQEVCRRLKEGQFKRVIVMAGAGISVSAGIPDFRSPGSGLYDTIDLEKHGLPSPQAVFDIDYFRKDPQPFFSVVKQLLPGNFKPTTAHYFVKLLSTNGLLLRCYTQNIDGLERATGLKEDYLIEAHGSLSKAKCTACGRDYTVDEVKETIMKSGVPKCLSCEDAVIKPGIVFFGEDLPGKFKHQYDIDFSMCDLLIVMGTSLKVQPFASLINKVKETTPRLLVNKERVGTFTLDGEGGYRDVAMIQDCDSAVEEMCRLCGWSKALKDMMNPPVVRDRAAAVNRTKTSSKKQTVVDHHHRRSKK